MVANPTLSAAGIDERLAGLVEEITAKLESGEAIDLDDYSGKYPAQIEQLRKLMPALEALALVGHDDRLIPSETPGSAADADGHRRLGDFRLIREIGRGGMGTVYEAEQISMGRHVALKVLPFAALVQDKSLQRFRNEVRAAAALDHPHIVSVYSIGEERGVHFYAMQLIRGQTLAEMVAEMRRNSLHSNRDARGGTTDANLPLPEREGTEAPTIDSSITPAPATKRIDQARISTAVNSYRPAEYYRAAVRLGIQAAEALQHAHEQGVLHRDIKPSNLMLDREGNVYVTDFGLARIEADAGMTMTGDIVGTLRYMAPEQALAKRVVIDHRADIYSLGATLYELLTLQPAFSETDRSELLKQIAFEEPRALRKLDRHIPAELETIVLKAMAKSPDDRYPTAQRLADDLLAFLEYRPIEAKSPSLANWVGKWMRRHTAFVTIAAVALTLISIVSASAAVLTLSAYRSEAVQRRETETNFQLASEAIDQMLRQMGGMLAASGNVKVGTELMTDATEFYEKLLRRRNDPELRFGAARANGEAAALLFMSSKEKEATELLKRASELFISLVTEFPNRPDYLAGLAAHYERVGLAEFSANRFAAAEQPWQESLRIWTRLTEQFPDDMTYRAGLFSVLECMERVALVTGRPKDAAAYRSRMSEVAKRLPAGDTQLKRHEGITDNATNLTRWVQLAVGQGEFDVALGMLNEAITFQRRLVTAWPSDHKESGLLYELHLQVAHINVSAGRHAAAANAVDTLVGVFPNSLRANHEGAALLLKCAELAETSAASAPEPMETGGPFDSDEFSPGAAASQYRKRAHELVERAHQASSRNHEQLDAFIRFLLTCPDGSFRDPTRALELAKLQVKEAPECNGSWSALSLAYYRTGDWQAADEASQKLVTQMVKGNFNPYDGLLLALIRWKQGRADEARDWYQKSLDCIKTNQVFNPRMLPLAAEADELIGDLPRDKNEGLLNLQEIIPL